jgi:alginate O-acetyltransferase complex protein AlgI
MHPLRSLLLLLIFLLVFTGLHYVVPFGWLFPPVSEFIPGDFAIRSVSGITPVETGSRELIDSVSPELTDTTVISDSVTWYPPPDPVNEFLDTLRYSAGQIRIMYYGDSQIEGDRITYHLRQILREGKGGTGPGLFLPLMPVMYTKSYSLRSSANWKRYNYLSYRAGEISHRQFGPFMVMCRFLPENETTAFPVTASVSVRPAAGADSSSAYYDYFRLFYGNADDIVNVVIKGDGRIKFDGILKKGGGFYEISCPLDGSKSVQIEFTGQVSPDIYGMSIESSKGVIIDNIPQRGSAGLEFTMVDKKNLSETYSHLSPDLFILHYGLNIVKNVAGDYSYYERGLVRQLTLLKELSPSTPVLVIGLTDMARREGDSIRSYPNIPAIIKAQKAAAKSAGASFFDTWSAMGGESSIIKWAQRKPPLAQKDYVHLTYTGADTLSAIIAGELFIKKETIIPEQKDFLVENDSIIAEAEVSEEGSSYEDGRIKLLASQVFRLLRYDPETPFIFTAPVFWLFFLLVLAGYTLFYRKLALRNAYLFLISIFFYYKSGGLFLFLLFLVILIDFTCGILIHSSGKRFMRRLFVLIAVISNLGLLAYFKYTGFIVESINDLFGTDFPVIDYLASFSNSHLDTSFDISYIILPVGISFFIFQSLSYIFDVSLRKMEPVRNIIDFGFYVSFFPQLVAGPIVRASEFIPQLYTKFHLEKREFSHALFLITKGLIKKIVIADFIAVNFIDRVFENPAMYSGFENLMAVYGYGLQIYCDFSGYTDIAIGLALILGFRLPLNFNSPYKAAGISDFWRRWHISLSRWLKDYLYIPLGGNRKGKFRSAINLLITMLLGGLWHGASLRFIIWGLLHGIGLVINRILISLFGTLKSGRLSRAVAVFFTFQFVSFCWIFFRAPDMNRVYEMLSQIVENFSPGSFLVVLPAYANVFLLMIVGYTIHFLPERIKEAYRGLFIKMPVVVQLAVIMIFAVLLYQMRSIDVMPFIYFRF